MIRPLPLGRERTLREGLPKEDAEALELFNHFGEATTSAAAEAASQPAS